MKQSLAKKIIKILTIAIFSIFVLTLLFSLYPQKVFSAQSPVRKEVNVESTSYIDDEGYEQNITDTTTTYYYLSNGDKAYSTTNRTRTYVDNEGMTHTFTNYQDKGGEWSNEEEIKNNEVEEKTEIKTTDGDKFIYTLLQPLPQEGEDLQKNVTLEEYLTWAFRFTLALAGFLAVMMIVIGGVEWIISGANEGMRSEAHKRISNAIYGLILALVSYLVLYTINPSLVDFNNNQFFKEKETTSSGGNSNGSDNNTNSNTNGKSNNEINTDSNSTNEVGTKNDSNKETTSAEPTSATKPGEANNPTIYNSPTGGTSGKMEQIQN